MTSLCSADPDGRTPPLWLICLILVFASWFSFSINSIHSAAVDALASHLHCLDVIGIVTSDRIAAIKDEYLTANSI